MGPNGPGGGQLAHGPPVARQHRSSWKGTAVRQVVGGPGTIRRVGGMDTHPTWPGWRRPNRSDILHRRVGGRITVPAAVGEWGGARLFRFSSSPGADPSAIVPVRRPIIPIFAAMVMFSFLTVG